MTAGFDTMLFIWFLKLDFSSIITLKSVIVLRIFCKIKLPIKVDKCIAYNLLRACLECFVNATVQYSKMLRIFCTRWLQCFIRVHCWSNKLLTIFCKTCLEYFVNESAQYSKMLRIFCTRWLQCFVRVPILCLTSSLPSFNAYNVLSTVMLIIVQHA